MTRRPSDIIRRGVPFTGSKLLDAINAAGAVPFGGRRILVTSSGPQASIREAGHQIIPKTVQLFPVILNAFTLTVANHWDYSWTQAKFDPTTGLIVAETSSPITWQTAGETKARNVFEQTNTSSIVRGGEPVTIGTSTITIGPVGFNAAGATLNMPVYTWIAGTFGNGNKLRVFCEPNPVTNVVCS